MLKPSSTPAILAQNVQFWGPMKQVIPWPEGRPGCGVIAVLCEQGGLEPAGAQCHGRCCRRGSVRSVAAPSSLGEHWGPFCAVGAADCPRAGLWH